MMKPLVWLDYIDELSKNNRPLHQKYCPFSNEYCREEDCALYPSCLNGLIQLVLNLNSMAAIAYLSFPKTPKEEMNS